MLILKKHGDKYWAVYDKENELICITVYKKGAEEVIRRLATKGFKEKMEAEKDKLDF